MTPIRKQFGQNSQKSQVEEKNEPWIRSLSNWQAIGLGLVAAIVMTNVVVAFSGDETDGLVAAASDQIPDPAAAEAPSDAPVNASIGTFNEITSGFASDLTCGKMTAAMPELGQGRLWSCILGEEQTAKLFVNEELANGSVKNIKVMWNDWYKDVGFGLHSDKVEAIRIAELVSQRLKLPVARIRTAMLANENVAIDGADHADIRYAYDRGPSIDERLVTITPTGRPMPVEEAVATPDPSSKAWPGLTDTDWRTLKADNLQGAVYVHARSEGDVDLMKNALFLAGIKHFGDPDSARNAADLMDAMDRNIGPKVHTFDLNLTLEANAILKRLCGS